MFVCYFILLNSTIPQGREVDRELTFRVLQHPLNQHRVLCYPLGDEQDALWDAQPPHNGAAHLFLGKTNKSTFVRTRKKQRGKIVDQRFVFCFFWRTLMSGQKCAALTQTSVTGCYNTQAIKQRWRRAALQCINLPISGGHIKSLSQGHNDTWTEGGSNQTF